MQETKLKVLWLETSNILAICDIDNIGLTMLTIMDEEYKDINPFLAYPLDILKSNIYGWIEIGEL